MTYFVFNVEEKSSCCPIGFTLGNIIDPFVKSFPFEEELSYLVLYNGFYLKSFYLTRGVAFLLYNDYLSLTHDLQSFPSGVQTGNNKDTKMIHYPLLWPVILEQLL